MKDAAALLQAISGFAWPIAVFVIFLVILPVLKQLGQAIQRGGGTIEVAGVKLTVQENSEQQRKIVESIQEKLAQVESKVGLSVDAGAVAEPEKKVGRILWVDDTPRNNAYIRAFLEDKGVSVELALSTDQALEKIALKQYDAIISDMARPGDERAGLTLTQSLRSKGNRLPILIFCNPWAAENLKDQASAAGAQGITSSAQDLISMLTSFEIV